MVIFSDTQESKKTTEKLSVVFSIFLSWKYIAFLYFQSLNLTIEISCKTM